MIDNKKKNMRHFCLFLFLVSILSFESVCLSTASNISTNKQQENEPVNSVSQSSTLPQQKVCDGNRFEFISSFVLGRQNDLTKTFEQIQKTIQLKNITHSDRTGRIYTIYNFKPQLLYLESKQVAEIKAMSVLNISGGSLRISYDFQWQKQQLGAHIVGIGSGVVSTDPITFQKTLQTNSNNELQWSYRKSNPITITNSLTLGKIEPYKDGDSQIINQMLNELDKNQTTAKAQLIRALNANFTNILKNIVKDDETISIPKEIQYSYYDYRGLFSVTFDNVLLENYLTKDGLTLILSQVIRGDKNFECGKRVPTDPESLSKYGGTQEYISNTFFNSTLKNALQSHSLDVTLSQENWQSRAFQFYVGDLHQVISSTRNVSSFKDLKGKCQAINDKNFGITKKTISSYSVKTNFTCYLQQNTTKIVDIMLPVEYEISPMISSRELNFMIKSIKGVPTFIENPKYKINNRELASFMLLETLNTAVKSKVIGSGFKVKTRKNAQLEVRDDYLFLYDKSTIKSFENEL